MSIVKLSFADQVLVRKIVDRRLPKDQRYRILDVEINDDPVTVCVVASDNTKSAQAFSRA